MPKNLKRFDYADTLALQIRALKLPVPEREYRFDSVRKWRFDLCWPALKLAVECDGGQWVTGRRRHGGTADAEKQNAAVAVGWHVLRFTGSQITSGSAVETLVKYFLLHAIITDRE